MYVIILYTFPKAVITGLKSHANKKLQSDKNDKVARLIFDLRLFHLCPLVLQPIKAKSIVHLYTLYMYL